MEITPAASPAAYASFSAASAAQTLPQGTNKFSVRKQTLDSNFVNGSDGPSKYVLARQKGDEAQQSLANQQKQVLATVTSMVEQADYTVTQVKGKEELSYAERVRISREAEVMLQRQKDREVNRRAEEEFRRQREEQKKRDEEAAAKAAQEQSAETVAKATGQAQPEKETMESAPVQDAAVVTPLPSTSAPSLPVQEVVPASVAPEQPPAPDVTLPEVSATASDTGITPDATMRKTKAVALNLVV